MQHQAPSRPQTPVSVVVAARNEAKALPELLDALERQEDAAFEVIVVDDHSTDNTRSLALSRAAKDNRVRVLANTYAPGKKGAMRTGIEAARFPWILCTDADAVPHPAWVRRMAAAGAPDRVVLGFPRATQGGGLARFELLHTQLLTIGSCGLGRPFMAYGIAFGFPTQFFHQAGGYAGWEALPGGDDDLLLQRLAALPGVEMRTALHPEAQVATALPVWLPEWVRQKRRHLSDGKAYPARILAHLALYHGTALLLWMGATTGPIGLFFLGLRQIVLALLVREAGRKLGEPWLWLATPPLDAMLTIFNVFLGPLSALFPPQTWSPRVTDGPESILRRHLSALFQKKRAG